MQSIYRQPSTPAPLSFSEELAWNEFKTDPELFFHRGAVLSADLPADAEPRDVQRILSDISTRHEVFRTAFETVRGQPARNVLPAFEHKVMEAAEPAYPLMGESSTDLSPDDLARVWLTPSPNGGKRVSIDINELITDSWSCAHLQVDLDMLAATCGSPVPVLPVPPVGYSDFAREQRKQELPSELADYWRGNLSGMGQPAYIEFDGPDPSGDIAGERVVIFSDDMTAALRAVCQQRSLTPFMAVVALVKMVLTARSGARDVALSTMTGTRARKWTEVQGNFSNTLLLRSQLPDDPSFDDVLSLSRTEVLGALRHRDMPALQLREILGTEVSLPPVRVQYLPHRAHHYRILDSRPSGDAWIEDAVFAGFPMDIGFAEDRRNRVAIWMSYDPKLFTHDSAGKLLDACCTVLRLAFVNPSLRCSDLRERAELG
jgi:hypothetical protein